MVSLVNTKLAALAAVVLLVGALFVLIQTSSGGSGTGGGDSATNCPTGPHQFAENETALGAFQCAQVTLSMVGGSSACSSGPPQQYAISIGTITDGALVCATPVTGFTQGSDTTRTGLLTFLNTTSIGVFLHGNNAEFEILAVPWSTITNFPTACSSGPPQQFVTAVGATLTCAAPATQTYAKLCDQVASAGAVASLTCSGLAAYAHYLLTVYVPEASVTSADLCIQINADATAAHYLSHSSYDATYVTSVCSATTVGLKIGPATSIHNDFWAYTINCFDNTQDDAQCAGYGSAIDNGASSFISNNAGYWESTAQITSFKLGLDAVGNLNQYSELAVWGYNS